MRLSAQMLASARGALLVAAAQVIEVHFSSPTWLVVKRDGPLWWKGPRGDLVIIVVDERGRPIPGLWCQYLPEDPETISPSEDLVGTDESGRCLLPNLPAAAYEIVLHQFIDNDHYEPIKQVRVVVDPGGTTITVVVEPR